MPQQAHLRTPGEQPAPPAVLRRGLANPVLLGAIGTLLLIAAVALVTRGIFNHSAPLGPDDIGAPATSDYKATRDFTYTEVDVGATDKKRDEASAAVLPVYDFDLEEKDRIVEQVRESFRFMQGLFADYHSRVDPLLAPYRRGRAGEGAGTGGGSGSGSGSGGWRRSGDGAEGTAEEPKGLPPEVLARKREADAWLVAQLEERREEFFRLLHQTLTQEELRVLLGFEFSTDLEDHLVYLVSGVMQYKVMPALRQLNRQRDEGIRLRITRGTTAVDEIDVRDDFSEFISIQDALERLSAMARRGLKGLDPEVRDRLVDVAGRLISSNCQHNRVETEARRERARAEVEALSITRPLRKGQIIVDRGHIITPQHVAIFRASQQESADEGLWLAAAGNSVIIATLVGILLVFFKSFIRKFMAGPRDLIFMGTWTVGMLGFYRACLAVTEAVAESGSSIPVDAWLYLIPVAAVPMLVRMVLNSETAVMVTIVEAMLVSILVGWNVPYLLFTIASGLTAAGGVGRAKQRTDLLVAALRTGAINAIFVVGLSAAGGTLLNFDGLAAVTCAMLGGVLAGLLVTAVLPVVEATFDYTTNIKLLELANLNNPLLKELAIRAPGTFHHSILVGNLVEIAAESIHSNPLLARVGAYYHDVGKIKAPHYFAENQRVGQNPHDKLRPSMSALILKEHVRDGAKLLRTRRYPRVLADICEQHVGTTLISFFYQKARTQAADRDEPPPLETDYRYPGPRPQTREAALVFLGDSVEAAAKSMADPSPARLQGMVQNIVNQRFIDGQLSECNLTLGDLHNIARAFTRGLTGIYHFRPEYPAAERSPARRRDETARRTSQTPLPTVRRPVAADVQQTPPPDRERDPAGPASLPFVPAVTPPPTVLFDGLNEPSYGPPSQDLSSIAGLDLGGGRGLPLPSGEPSECAMRSHDGIANETASPAEPVAATGVQHAQPAARQGGPAGDRLRDRSGSPAARPAEPDDCDGRQEAEADADPPRLHRLGLRD